MLQRGNWSILDGTSHTNSQFQNKFPRLLWIYSTHSTADIIY